MTLPTGTPLGTTSEMEGLYLEGAPYFYFQEYDDGHYEHSPDTDGFYWNLSGTPTAPVYQAGCYEDVSLKEDLTINEVRCDAIGDKSSTMRRNFLDLALTLSSLFPLEILRHIVHGGAVTLTADESEKMGIGSRDNSTFWRVYLPKVYDETAGDFVCITGHRCQFISALELEMPGDAKWTTSVTVRLFADDSLPSAQKFATMVRVDPSAL